MAVAKARTIGETGGAESPPMPIHADRKRFDRLYDEYHRLVRNVLFNMTGDSALDDLVQETFLKVWQGLPRFAFRSTVKTWVYRIAMNVAIDHLRRRRFTAPLDFDPKAEERPLASREKIVAASLAELDELHRGVVVLHYFEEM